MQTAALWKPDKLTKLGISTAVLPQCLENPAGFPLLAQARRLFTNHQKCKGCVGT